MGEQGFHLDLELADLECEGLHLRGEVFLFLEEGAAILGWGLEEKGVGLDEDVVDLFLFELFEGHLLLELLLQFLVLFYELCVLCV